MAGDTDSVAELLIAARRAQILDAAAKVFAEKGFHRATIKEVARTAGVADGTIYTYFTNKTDLLLGLLNRLNESEQRELDFVQGSAQDIKSFFVSYLRQRITLLWPNAEVFRVVLPEMLANAQLRELYYKQVIEPTSRIGEQYFHAQIEQGHMRKIDVPLTVRAIAGTILGLLVIQLLGDAEIAERWQELPEVLATMMFDGLQSSIEQVKGEE